MFGVEREEVLDWLVATVRSSLEPWTDEDLDRVLGETDEIRRRFDIGDDDFLTTYLATMLVIWATTRRTCWASRTLFLDDCTKAASI